MPKSPSEKTVKRLFATYGNQCAFPNCTVPLVNSDGTVLAEICHIEGHKPSAARYDASQSDEERHGFDNLILLCAMHHKVIDDDPVAYTVERLVEMKRSHEAKHAGGQEPSDDIVGQLLSKMNLIEDIHAAVVNGAPALSEIQKAGRYMELIEAKDSGDWYRARELCQGIETYEDVGGMLGTIQIECEKLDELGKAARSAYVAKDPLTLVQVVQKMGTNATPELLKYAEKSWNQIPIAEPLVLYRALLSEANPVASLVITPDDRFLVAGFSNREVFSSELKVRPVFGSPHRMARYHVRAITAITDKDRLVVFSPSSPLEVGGWYYDTTYMKSNSEFELRKSYADPDLEISALGVTPDGTRLIQGFSDGRIWIGDLTTGDSLCSYVGHNGEITALAVLNNGNTLISGSLDGTIRVWDMTSCRRTTQGPGQRATASYIHDTVNMVTVPGCRIAALCIASEGELVVFACRSGGIRTWNRRTNEVNEHFGDSGQKVNAVVAAPDGAHIITGADDGKIAIWDLNQAKMLRVFTHPQDKSDYRRPTSSPIKALALSSDGQYLVSGSDDGTVCLFEYPSGLLTKVSEGSSEIS